MGRNQFISRRDNRYAMAPDKVLPAKIQFDNEDCSTEATALDISSRGAKLEVNQPVSEHGPVQIEITNGSDSTITAAGSTCWARPVTENAWWLGVAFDQPINDDEMNQLAEDGYIDRRQDRRDAMDQGMLARCELSDKPVDIELRDLSMGGIGLWSTRKLEEDSRLIVATNERDLDARPVICRVKWVRSEGDGWTAGCSFLAKEGYPEIRRQLANQMDLQRLAGRRRYSVRYMVGLLAGVAMLALWTIFLFRF